MTASIDLADAEVLEFDAGIDGPSAGRVVTRHGNVSTKSHKTTHFAKLGYSTTHLMKYVDADGHGEKVRQRAIGKKVTVGRDSTSSVTSEFFRKGFTEGVSSTVSSFAGTSSYSKLEEDESIDVSNLQFEIEHLKEAGLNLDAITRYVYEHLHNQKLPNFMQFVTIDQDGGLDRVDKLWYNQRVFWAVVLLAFVSMNVIYLIVINYDIFWSFTTHIWAETQQETTDLLRHKTLNTMSDNTEKLLQNAEESAKGSEAVDIYFHIEDPERRTKILVVAGIVGTVEVLWVLIKVIHALYQCLVFMTFTGREQEYRRYRTAIHLFLDSLPVLSTFSLLKFVSFVHPSMIATHYFEHLQDRWFLPNHWLGGVLTTIYFVSTRLILAAAAVAAFATKLLSVALKLVDPRYKFTTMFVETGLLMNQCMGCVLFERVLQDRLFLFMFGGSDSDFREDEQALKGVYRCRLAKEIWDVYWTKAKTCHGWKALVMMMTLDHFDLQMLLIDDTCTHAHSSSEDVKNKHRSPNQNIMGGHENSREMRDRSDKR